MHTRNGIRTCEDLEGEFHGVHDCRPDELIQLCKVGIKFLSYLRISQALH